jgi:hypothetical protein
MSDDSVSQKTQKGEVVQDSLSKDEIDQLSDLISDSPTSNQKFDPDRTGSFHHSKGDDTGKFTTKKDKN